MIRAATKPSLPWQSRLRCAQRGTVDGKALHFLLAQMQPRTPYRSSVLVPADDSIDRHASGAWTGTWSLPPAQVAAPYTPILLQGPLWFPLVAGQPADFNGRVDVPFYSMDGWSGRRDMANPSPPPSFITDPATVYADGGVNWGRYHVVGSVAGITQFVAPIAANATWTASVSSVPAGDWSFQIVTYGDASDALADINRILVGDPWRESDRPGNARDYYAAAYVAGAPQFTNVALSHPGDYRIAGTLAPFAAMPGRTYQILVTNETDVEYCWALAQVTTAGAFTITRPQPFGGKIKLRLVEQLDGCSVRVVGQVWAEENAADTGAYPDLRVEYRAITGAFIPTFPESVQPAQSDRTWSVTLAGGGAVGRVSLVSVNTKRVYGEWTMPTGLMRSFNVPPAAFGQTTAAAVYFDGFNDTCFLYDQAVALIALLQLGEREAALKLVDALQGLQNPDGSFGFARNQAILSPDTSLIRNGSESWVCYALLLADQSGWMSTAAAAKAGLAQVMTYINGLGLVDGGVGVPWWSTEHNIDAWWCLDLADQLYGGGVVDYAGAAAAIKASLLADGIGWDGANGIFWQGGTVVGGVNTSDNSHALDTHTWGANLLAKWGLSSDAAVSIARAYELYYVTETASGRSGFTSFIPGDGYPPETVLTPWLEGSFGAVAALRYVDPPRADGLMRMLARSQLADGSYPYALQDDPANSIRSWPCVIAPAWNVLAACGPGTPTERLFWRVA